MVARKVLVRIGVAAIALMPAVAHAQSAPPENVSVADRPHPDYDPIGARVGAFTLYPAVNATALATDNYLATAENRRSDIYLLVTPELLATTDDGRSRTQSRAFFTRSVHANLPDEDTSQYGLSTSGAYDVTRQTQLRADAAYSRYTESRASLGAFQGSREPVNYSVLHGGLGGSHVFNDLTVGVDGAVDYRNYNDTSFPDGRPIDQDYRDVREVSVSGSARYALRNGIGLLFSGSYSDEHYPTRQLIGGTVLNRDSSGFDLEGGVSLELTHLIFGHIQIGYLNRTYPDPAFDDVSGLSYSADVLWNATPLTSYRITGSRSVQDTSSPLIAGNTVSAVHFYVDHELYRYIILSGDAGYDRFTPNGVGVGGEEYTIGASARYLIDRRYTLSGGLRYSQRTSDSQFLRYHAVSASVTLRVAL